MITAMGTDTRACHNLSDRLAKLGDLLGCLDLEFLSEATTRPNLLRIDTHVMPGV